MNDSYRAISEEYVKWVDTLGFSNHLVHNCRRNIRVFLDWLESREIGSIDKLTDKHIIQYFNYSETRSNMNVKNRLLSAAHLNKIFYTVDKFLEFLHQNGMENAPVPVNRRMEINQQERILKIETFTQQEIKTLYDTIPETYPNLTFVHRQAVHYEIKLYFALFYGCGLRRSEGFNLQIQNIDFDKKTVFVEQGKNYKDRIVPMSAGVYRDLQDYVYNYRHRLKLNHNRLLTTVQAQYNIRLKHLQNTCQDKNIRAKRLSVHVLRHSIATHLLQNGMSIENIALFLGHSSLDSTQIYTHIINEI